MKEKLKMRGLMTIRNNHNCHCCRKTITKGSLCFTAGSNYVKYCIECHRDFSLPKRVKRLKVLIKETSEELKQLNKNFAKYEQLNIIANLK